MSGKTPIFPRPADSPRINLMDRSPGEHIARQGHWSASPHERMAGQDARTGQVLMALVNVSRFPKGSVTVKSRVPQGICCTSGRA